MATIGRCCRQELHRSFVGIRSLREEIRLLRMTSNEDDGSKLGRAHNALSISWFGGLGFVPDFEAHQVFAHFERSGISSLVCDTRSGALNGRYENRPRALVSPG